MSVVDREASGRARAELRLRAVAAESEFVERMFAAYRSESARDEHALDAESLLDRLRDALTEPLSLATFDDVIQGVAADLFGDDRWAGDRDAR